MSEELEQKTARNIRVAARYDALISEGRHGHYETLFRVVREEVEAWRPSWNKCDTHGPAKAGAWGCPECVREMRSEIEPLRATLGIALAALEYHRDQTRPIGLSDEAIAVVRLALRKEHPASCGCRACDVARNQGVLPMRGL